MAKRQRPKETGRYRERHSKRKGRIKRKKDNANLEFVRNKDTERAQVYEQIKRDGKMHREGLSKKKKGTDIDSKTQRDREG